MLHDFLLDLYLIIKYDGLKKEMVFLSCTALWLKRVARFFFYVYYVIQI